MCKLVAGGNDERGRARVCPFQRGFDLGTDARVPCRTFLVCETGKPRPTMYTSSYHGHSTGLIPRLYERRLVNLRCTLQHSLFGVQEQFRKYLQNGWFSRCFVPFRFTKLFGPLQNVSVKIYGSFCKSAFCGLRPKFSTPGGVPQWSLWYKQVVAHGGGLKKTCKVYQFGFRSRLKFGGS